MKGLLVSVFLLVLHGTSFASADVTVCSNPEEVLKELIASFEKAANAKADKENPPEPKEELDLDEEALDDDEKAIAINPDTTDRLLNAGDTYVATQHRDRNFAEVARICRACLALRVKTHASAKSILADRFTLAEALSKTGHRAEARKMLEEQIDRGEAVFDSVKALFGARCDPSDPVPAYDWFEQAIVDRKYGFTKSQQAALRNFYAFKAFYTMRVDLMKKAIRLAEEHDVTLVGHGAMCKWSIAKQEEMKTFPKAESEIRFPASAKDFGVDVGKKVVHVKDFGWDEEDATECIVAALDQEGTTFVFDDMGSPWYVTGLTLTDKQASNRQFVFKPGVKVLAKNDNASWMKTIFGLKGVKNAMWIAEGDVQIGHFADLAARKKVRAEGGTAVALDGVGNFALKGFRLENACCDGLTIGGGSHDIYVQDCDMNNDFRQGASFGASSNCHFRNCKFRNIGPGLPGSGVDFEPSYEVYPNNNYYFFDCLFTDNGGDGVTFATSTYLPVTVHFKRCTIASTATALCIKARPGIYFENDAAAPSKLVFDDCTFLGNSEVDPIRFWSTSLFNVTFRNCTLTDRGPFYPGRAPTAPAFWFLFDRNLWQGANPKDGLITFENFTVNGYTNAPLFALSQGKDVTYRPSRFTGTVIHNGKPFKVDGMEVPAR